MTGYAINITKYRVMGQSELQIKKKPLLNAEVALAHCSKELFLILMQCKKLDHHLDFWLVKPQYKYQYARTIMGPQVHSDIVPKIYSLK